MSTDHLEWIGKYIAYKKPEVVVCLGDFADMPSLSSYDKGKKSFEGRRYKADVNAVQDAMARLMKPIKAEKGYKPRLVLTLGNHEDRICRAVEDDPKLEGTIGLEDLDYEAHGWQVYDFLDPVLIDGIEYSHYFVSGSMGRAVSSARALLNARMGSAIMGHNQITDVAFHPRTQHIAIMAGAAYLHDEPYLGIQGNRIRRQIIMLHEVRNGLFDPMFVSLDYLRRRYS